MPTRKHITAKQRERIKTGVILDRVHKHILGELELSATQIQAARILLNKTMPDLKAVEHQGDAGITVNLISQLSDGHQSPAD